MKNISCNLCGKNDSKILYALRDRMICISDSTLFLVVKCRNCGLMYVQPQPNPEDLCKFYSEDYYTHKSTDQGEESLSRTFLFLRQIKRFLFGVQSPSIPPYLKWANYKKEEGRFLDVGCGNGKRAEMYRDIYKKEWDFFGVEVDPIAADIARRKSGLNVTTGSLHDANYPDEYFDVIFMRHVLEHVTDPYAALAETRRILKKDGKLIIVLPNHASLGATILGKYWYGLDVPRHLFFFTSKTAGSLLVKTGFSMERLEYAILADAWRNSLSYLLYGKRVKWLSGQNIFTVATSRLFCPLNRILERGSLAGEIRILAQKG